MPKQTIAERPAKAAEKTPTPQTGPGNDALSIANRLRPVLLRLNRSLRGEAHEMGVTSTQTTLLGAIKRSPGIGLGDLAAQEQMVSPTLVAHIDKLEDAGLVERTRSDPHDRRRVELYLTESGLQVWNKILERRTAWLATRLAKLSSDELNAIVAAIEPLQKLAHREARDGEERQA